MSGIIVVEILGVFALMFVGIVITVLYFTHSSSKIESKKEIQKRKMEIYDKHFSEMIRIECPYCMTLYSANKSECPNCGADTKKIRFPEIPK